MKKSRFSEEKIIGILREGDAGVKVAVLARRALTHVPGNQCQIALPQGGVERHTLGHALLVDEKAQLAKSSCGLRIELRQGAT